MFVAGKFVQARIFADKARGLTIKKFTDVSYALRYKLVCPRQAFPA